MLITLTQTLLTMRVKFYHQQNAKKQNELYLIYVSVCVSHIKYILILIKPLIVIKINLIFQK